MLNSGARARAVNHKRVQRPWHKHGLQVPQRPKKRRIKTGRSVPCQAQHPDHVWSYDFREDALLSGRKVRLLNILDEFTREWLSVTVGVSLTSQAVMGALRVLFAARGVPAFVRSDNGPEFIAAEVQAWQRESGAAPHYIDPAARGRMRSRRASTGSCATSSWIVRPSPQYGRRRRAWKRSGAGTMRSARTAA